MKPEQDSMKIDRIDNRPTNRTADVINISDCEEEEEEEEDDEEEVVENESSTNQKQQQQQQAVDEYSEPSHRWVKKMVIFVYFIAMGLFFSLDNSQELVTSSTECFTTNNCEMQQLEHPYSDAVEKVCMKFVVVEF